MEQNTKAVEGFAGQQKAVEKTVDELKAAVRAATAEVSRYADEKGRHATELERKNDLRQRELDQQRELYGQRWARATKIAKNGGDIVIAAMSRPWISLPLGALAYGLARVIATYFGFDISEMP